MAVSVVIVMLAMASTVCVTRSVSQWAVLIVTA